MPTWWCGEPDGLERVLDHLDTLQVRRLDGPAVDLSGLRRDTLTAMLLAEPHRFVGQQRLPLSQSPTWEDGRPVPRPLTLRAFTLRYGSAYRPLVGGLASIVEDGISIGSKDVWVLKADPMAPDQGLAEVLPMTNTRASTGIVPRILEDMFWFGRYAERAEDLLRLVLAVHAQADDYRSRPRSTGAAGLDVMLGALTRLAGPGLRSGDDLDAEFRSVLLDARRVGSVTHALGGLRTALSGVRDQLSLDVWRAFGSTDRAASVLGSSAHSHQVAESAGRMLTGILSLQGATASMIRDPGWHMIAVGRYLERGLQVVHLLAATTTVRRGLDVDREVLNAVLAAAESSVTHRRRYRGSVRPGGVLELLLTDRDNPRSLAFALDQVALHLDQLPASTGSSRPERLVGDLVAELAETDIATLVAIGGESRPNLEAFLARFVVQLARVADAITEVHLTTGPQPRPLAALPLVESLEAVVS